MITQSRLPSNNNHSHQLDQAPNKKTIHFTTNQFPSPLRSTLPYQVCQKSKHPNRTASTSKVTTSSQARTAFMAQIDLNMFSIQIFNN